jgi:hypothetical protein
MLARLINSLLDTSAGDQRIEILVSIDDDDPAWKNGTNVDLPATNARVAYTVGPRPKTLGEKLNILAARATGEILTFLANDYVMLTHGWPGIMREAVARLPGGIGVPFPEDSLHPDHASFPIITRRMYEAGGMFAPPWFPYWYVDTWWDEVGIMLGVRPEIAVEVSAPEGRGKPQGLRDVTFWATFFDKMRPFRARDARGLAWKVWGKDSDRTRHLEEMIDSRVALCAARNGHLVTPEFAAVWEGQTDETPTPEYDKVKAYASAMLANIVQDEAATQTKVLVAVPSGRTWEATTANDLMALSAYSVQAGITLAFLNLQTSQISIARNNTVKIALDMGVDYIFWVDSDMSLPPDTLVRLLSHGRPISGAVYNKKTPRPGSSPEAYETLGRLIPPEDGQITDGLSEALLMPGGVMLVATEVYKKLHWPWYAEAYRWAPDLDGLSAFKVMMREYLGSVPSDAVLDSIDGTLFGQWLAEGYRIGDNGCNSEDYFFCGKARQAGFKIFADLGLTNRIGHIGQKTVTCTLPESVIRLAAE